MADVTPCVDDVSTLVDDVNTPADDEWNTYEGDILSEMSSHFEYDPMNNDDVISVTSDDEDSYIDDGAYEEDDVDRMVEEMDPLSFPFSAKIVRRKTATKSTTTATTNTASTTTTATTHSVRFTQWCSQDWQVRGNLSLVHCSNCDKCAVHTWETVRCRYCKTVKNVGAFHGAYFLSANFMGKSLWACNLRHLMRMENFVSTLEYSRAPVREHYNSNSSFSARLPGFFRSDRKRPMLLRKLAQMIEIAKKEEELYRIPYVPAVVR